MQICRFVALCEGDVCGMALTLYDLSQQLDAFPPSLNFSNTLLVLVLLVQTDNRKYCGNSQFNTYSVCSAVLTTVTKETKGVVQTVSLSIQ